MKYKIEVKWGTIWLVNAICDVMHVRQVMKLVDKLVKAGNKRDSIRFSRYKENENTAPKCVCGTYVEPKGDGLYCPNCERVWK